MGNQQLRPEQGKVQRLMRQNRGVAGDSHIFMG
nr:MAG TPA: hypothetical protein [Caudoviricetes sp.]